jgi:hypothetical protein
MPVQQPQEDDCCSRMLIAVLKHTGLFGLLALAGRRWAVVLQQAWNMLLVVPGGPGRQALDWVRPGIDIAAEEPRWPCLALLEQEFQLLETALAL